MTHPEYTEGSKYVDIFQERQQKGHQELHTNLPAIISTNCLPKS